VGGMLQSCSHSKKVTGTGQTNAWEVTSTVTIKKNVAARKINTKSVKAEELTGFAETLLGIPYKYGSMKKEDGFDCSGFVNYVFNHFGISVPRTTVDFTNAGMEVSIMDSHPGDLILFTGSDAKSGVVGHMGIITENKKNSFWFIHAATSKGVMISPMNAYFIPRFVKVIRIFPG
jgi:cell wall-associated NlpC family hydrolase